MSSVFTTEFWRDTAERVISSAAQGALVGWGAGSFTSLSEVATAGQIAAFGALGMAIATFLKCLIASKLGDEGTASVISLAPPAAGKHESGAADGEGVDTGQYGGV